MRYLTVKETAEKWGLKERRVRSLCQEGLVPNVMRFGRNWMIPEDAVRPVFGKPVALEENDYFDMYLNPTYYENNRHRLLSSGEKLICQATELFYLGQFEEAEAMLESLVDTCRDESFLLVAYSTLYESYMSSKNNKKDSTSAGQYIYKYISTVSGKTFCSLYYRILSSEDISSFDIYQIPDKYIPIISFALIYRNINDAISQRAPANIGQAEFLCRLCSLQNNPGITLYIHCTLAMYYFLLVNQDAYEYHVSKALEIAIPHKWYGPLAQYSYIINWNDTGALDSDTLTDINRLSKIVINNYTLNGYYKRSLKNFGETDSTRIRVSFMLANGKSNNEIAETLDISMYKVKSYVKKIYEAAGVSDKKQFGEYFRYHFTL